MHTLEAEGRFSCMIMNLLSSADKTDVDDVEGMNNRSKLTQVGAIEVHTLPQQRSASVTC
jgi:hypothetical protein